MAITNAEAVSFSNQRVRVAADKIAQAYYFAKIVVNEWNANSMSSLISNDSEVIVDGSSTDGRHQVTGAEATNIITRCSDMITDMEANTNAKLNTILAVATHTD